MKYNHAQSFVVYTSEKYKHYPKCQKERKIHTLSQKTSISTYKSIIIILYVTTPSKRPMCEFTCVGERNIRERGKFEPEWIYCMCACAHTCVNTN